MSIAVRALRVPSTVVAAVAAVLGFGAGPGPARAEGPVVLKPGKVVLPITGLAIDLPKDKRRGFTWQLSASFALSQGGGSFDGRDVVDEKLDGQLVGGTWVQVGNFDVGGCAAVAAAADLGPDAWSDARELFGVRWHLRGGLFSFEGELGAVPAVAMCAEREDRKALLVYRFFIAPRPAGKDELVAALARATVVERATDAWKNDRWAAVETRRRPEVRDRGDVRPVREVTLPKSGLTLTLPDDGFVWLVRTPDPDDTVDWLDRMAPAQNEITIEIARVPDATCALVLDDIPAEKRPGVKPTGVPAGWIPGPTLVIDGDLERVVCKEVGGAAVLVGLFNVPDTGRGAGDFKPLARLLAAIAAAKTTP